MKSLQDQLLKAGLVDEKSVKQANKVKRKQQKVQRKSRQIVVDEVKEQVEAKRLAKVERDRALNQERNEIAGKKAISAQIKQLIEVNSVDYRGDVEYNFADGRKIKKIAVSTPVQQQLSRGRLAIAKLGDSYFIIACEVAEKVSQRNDSYIVLLNSRVEEAVDEDDPYADFQIPDDLMW